MERGSYVAHQQDPRLDGVDTGHHEGHFISAQDPRQSHRQDVHQGLVSHHVVADIPHRSTVYGSS